MLVPEHIESFDSAGEKILYIRFKNDVGVSEMYILHSLFTNHHLKNISGELDFLIIAPNKGVFSIEVKHGGVSRKDGVWKYKNRFGAITSKTKSPFAQVDGTMNSIRKYVLKKVKHKKILHDRLSKILWGTGIAFTSMENFVDFGTEGYSWQVLTKEGLNYPISYYIDALSKGWHEQNSNKYWYDGNNSRPTKKDSQVILNILRGDFEIDYTEINKILDNESLIDEFTKEQFSLLDFVNYNDRCLVEGSAGTGKTLMAIEVFNRQIKNGKKIALFCFNKQLGDKLSKYANNINASSDNENFAGTLHSFMIQKSKASSISRVNNINTYYREHLPIEFIIEQEDVEETEKFDFIILDEAQDLISPYYLEVFNTVLKGGLTDGKWIFFGDFTHQSIFQDDASEKLKALNEISTFTRFPSLKVNCRNTKKIAYQNALLTGTVKPDFATRTINGTPIVNKFVTNNSGKTTIEGILKNLIKKEIPLKKITLLSPKKIENTCLSNSKYVESLVKEGLSFQTIQAFKGLENTIIILFGFDEITSPEAQNLLYVGISRARLTLYTIFNKNLENNYQKIIQKNIQLKAN